MWDVQDIKYTVSIGVLPADHRQSRRGAGVIIKGVKIGRTGGHNAVLLHKTRSRIVFGIQILGVVVPPFAQIQIGPAPAVLVVAPEHVVQFVGKRPGGPRRWHDHKSPPCEGERLVERATRCEHSVSVVLRVHHENGKSPIRVEIPALGVVEREDVIR